MVVKKNILLIDDNNEFCEALAEHFSLDDEFHIEIVKQVGNELFIQNSQKFDLVLLDISKNFSRLTRLNYVYKYVAYRELIIFSSEILDDKIKKLLGGSSYVFFKKPVRLGEVDNAVRNLFEEKVLKKDNNILKFQCYLFDPLERYLENKENMKIVLTESETKILELLYENRGKVVLRAKLLTQILGYSKKVKSHALETHIYRLRKKIEPLTKGVVVIESMNGGYKLKL